MKNIMHSGTGPNSCYVRLKKISQAWKRDERGASAIEYGLIGSLVFLAIIVAVTAFGTALANMFNTVSTTVAATVG